MLNNKKSFIVLSLIICLTVVLLLGASLIAYADTNTLSHVEL